MNKTFLKQFDSDCTLMAQKWGKKVSIAISCRGEKKKTTNVNQRDTVHIHETNRNEFKLLNSNSTSTPHLCTPICILSHFLFVSFFFCFVLYHEQGFGIKIKITCQWLQVFLNGWLTQISSRSLLYQPNSLQFITRLSWRWPQRAHSTPWPLLSSHIWPTGWTAHSCS